MRPDAHLLHEKDCAMSEYANADTTGNLPPWPGAANVYSRCYAILKAMGERGHVTRTKYRGRVTCRASAEMTDLIEALNGGDEETIKALQARHLHYVLGERRLIGQGDAETVQPGARR